LRSELGIGTARLISMSTLAEVAGKRGLFTDGDWILSENMSKYGTIGVIQLKHVGVGEFIPKDFQFITEETFDELGCTEVLTGDVLISRMADPLARACILPKLPFRTVTAVDVSILRVDDSIADRNYITQLCNSRIVRDRAEVAARGTTRSRITRTELGEIEIPLPPLPQQQQIADLLVKADRLRRMRRSALHMCDDLRRGIFQEFCQRVSTELSRYTFGDTEIIQIIDGDRGAAYPKGTDFGKSGHCLFLNTGNVLKGAFDFSKCDFITSQKDKELRKGKLVRGDVVLTTRGTLGNNALYDKSIKYEHVRINSGMVILRVNIDELLPDYLIAILNSDDFANQVLALT
jgi:type I restriction enzyme, S subunit